MMQYERQPFYSYYQRLIVGTMAASLFFVAGLLFLEVNFFRIAFNFLCMVSGFLLAMHLLRLAICQNLATLVSTETLPEQLEVLTPDSERGTGTKTGQV